MAVLNIRNLSDEVHARLRIRAAMAGRSMEAEARAILTEACAEPADVDEASASSVMHIQEWVDQLFGPNKPSNEVEDLIAERRAEAARE